MKNMLSDLVIWFRPGWWSYLLRGCTGWRHFVCRVKGHPCGPVWYNAGGSSPNMRCRNCREDLG